MLEMLKTYLEKKITTQKLNEWERAELVGRRLDDEKWQMRLKRAERNFFLTGVSVGIGLSSLLITIAAIVTAALLR